MERAVVASGSKVVCVGDPLITHGVPVPPELSGKTDQEIVDQCEIWNGKLRLKSDPKTWKQLKIALVSVYKIPCGISTYSEMLFPEVINKVSDYRIFSEYSDEAPVEDKVVRCFSRGEPLDHLADEIHEFKPDIVLVQHEYGIFPDARYWLSFCAEMQRYKFFVMFHSVYKHEDKLVCESAVPHALVHTEIAKQVAEEKGFSGDVQVVPHGCIPCKSTAKLWNIYRTKHTFIQFGFGFEYKGWENSIRAAAILKEKHPDVFFTGLFSESSYSRSLHDAYYSRLDQLVESLGIRNNVAIIRGYQTDSALQSFLRVNKVAVFPYKENGVHTVYACTGAARIAMSCGVPVVTSSVPLFHDLEGVCERGETPEEIAEKVEKLWNDTEAKAVIQRQNIFLEENSWDQVAKKYLTIMS